MKSFFVGMRKFLMAAVFLFVSIILLVAGVVPAETWMQYMSDVMVAFMATNVGEHIIEVGKKWIDNKKWMDVKDALKNAK